MYNGTPKIVMLAFLLLNLSLLTLAQGTQFITGPCKSDADCASACCGFKSGLCAGPIIAQQRDGGCGFGDPQPNANAAIALGFKPTATSPIASVAVTVSAVAVTATTTSKPPGTQFITGPCKSDADCADGCCGFNTGLCAGPVIAQERDGGCGFGDAQPNDNAAKKLQGGKRMARAFRG
ncbi:hypothetical protein K432DRAFT_408494 [Lepidopterella palustris CBS 459.81]|uniref:Biotrophy-associated secreted protein 2 n=1 Tax=Lepidopterella palustris CBS 459.81 TaxID=1314670 RepID=A0A8E2JB76_9PEZI|nr:hypothetical protein K432DRAFT_408494 [Lepidopterella palustris CBS 459.81]